MNIHWVYNVQEASGKLIPTKCSAYEWEFGYRFVFKNYRNHYYFEIPILSPDTEEQLKQIAIEYFNNLDNRQYMFVGKCIRCEKFRDNILEQFCERCSKAINHGNQDIDYLDRLKRF